MMVATEVGLPGSMMSERDNKKLILMLRRIDEMHQRNDTLETGCCQMGGAVDAAPEKVGEIALGELMTQYLEMFIATAVRNKDGFLTIQKCKDMLATHFGQPSVEEQKIHRICRSPACIQVQLDGAEGIRCDPILPCNA
jgi:hypothetical protein